MIYDVSRSQESVCVQTPQWRPSSTVTAVLIWPSLSSLIKLSLSDHLILMAGFIRFFSLLNTELKQFHTILETIRPRILIMVGKYSDSMQSLVDKLHFWSLGITLPYKNSNFLQLFCYQCILLILWLLNTLLIHCLSISEQPVGCFASCSDMSKPAVPSKNKLQSGGQVSTSLALLDKGCSTG